MKNNKNIICKCGHEKKFHHKVGAPIWEEWCSRVQDRKKGNFVYTCSCIGYIPDNLLHVENLAKKRKLI